MLAISPLKIFTSTCPAQCWGNSDKDYMELNEFGLRERKSHRLPALLCVQFKILDGIMIIFCVRFAKYSNNITRFCQNQRVKAHERIFCKLEKSPAVLKMMKVD